jgi:hypothetical protein
VYEVTHAGLAPARSIRYCPRWCVAEGSNDAVGRLSLDHASTIRHGQRVHHGRIVREVSGGTPLVTIEKDLNQRGIPSPRGNQWLRGIIRKQAMNPAGGRRLLWLVSARYRRQPFQPVGRPLRG